MPVRLHFRTHQLHAVVPRGLGGAKKSCGALFGRKAFVLADAQRLDQFIEFALPLPGEIFARFLATAQADQTPGQQITDVLADASWSIPAVELLIGVCFGRWFSIAARKSAPIAFHVRREF